MGGSEVYLAIILIGGFSFLLLRRHYRAVGRKALAAHAGLHYSARGLDALPPELQGTVLFAVSRGGHERDVVDATPVIASESVPFTAFDFDFQRDVRGEWAYLDAEPPFRLTGPTTVLAYELPAPFAHLVLKRAGDGDAIGEEPLEALQTLAHAARDASSIDRAIAVEPPGELPRAMSGSFGPDGAWKVWIADGEQARQLLTPELRGYLLSPASGDRELVIELLGRLLVVYPATGGTLSQSELVATRAFADELTRRILLAVAPAAQRGYVPST